jgi:hypothetical protein
MISRREFTMGALMAGDGLRRPLNAPPAGIPVPGVQPGSPGIVIAHFIIVTSAGGVFIYSGTPAHGNPPIAWMSGGTADPYGNTLPSTTGVAASGTFSAGNTLITTSGTFIYSGTPATGNLIYSTAAFSGTDAFGNHYLGGGGAWYAAAAAVAVQTGNTVQYYTGSLASGWTAAAADIVFNSSTQIVINGNVVLDTGSLTVDGTITSTAGTAATPTLITTDSWNTATLLNSWAGSGSATNGLFYRLTPDNMVQLVGDLTSPGTASVIATLPAAYRPATAVNVEWNRYDDSGTAHATVGTNGNITMQTTVGSGHGLFVNAFVPLGSL